MIEKVNRNCGNIQIQFLRAGPYYDSLLTKIFPLGNKNCESQNSKESGVSFIIYIEDAILLGFICLILSSQENLLTYCLKLISISNSCIKIQEQREPKFTS